MPTDLSTRTSATCIITLCGVLLVAPGWTSHVHWTSFQNNSIDVAPMDGSPMGKVVYKTEEGKQHRGGNINVHYESDFGITKHEVVVVPRRPRGPINARERFVTPNED